MVRRAPHLVLLCALCLAPRAGKPCTSIIVTRGASADGSTMVTYAADAHDFFGELQYTPAGRHPAGAMRDVYEWDSGRFLGRIKQAPVTYRVVGNMNEHQVVIAETTFGGRKELQGSKGIVDYGSMIYIALERSRSAREAIKVMTDLVAEYGYASEGESLSVADAKEAWIFEIIGKGPDRKGAVWVARRVPDGFVTAHANRPRIRQVPLHDPQNCIYSKDVISFAREKGWFKGRDEEFSFADVYDPPTAKSLRTCDARVWRIFTRVAPSQKIPIDYVLGVDGAKPLPLWVKPDRKLGVRDVMELMRDHFEGTPLDLSKGVGAGPHALPYRWRPLTWKVDGVEYMNERSTSTQQTGFSFVSQSRAWLPPAIGGLLWFGVDDTYSTVYVPIYSGIHAAPKAFAVGTGSFREFTWESAFWVFNFVANYAYGRYADMIGDIRKVQAELEGSFLAQQPEVEETALRLHRTAPGQARDYLHEYSARQTALTVQRWRKLGESLIVKYLDGNLRDEKGKVSHPGYPESWYRHVAKDCGARCRVGRLKNEPPEKPAAHGPAGVPPARAAGGAAVPPAGGHGAPQPAAPGPRPAAGAAQPAAPGPRPAGPTR